MRGHGMGNLWGLLERILAAHMGSICTRLVGGELAALVAATMITIRIISFRLSAAAEGDEKVQMWLR